MNNFKAIISCSQQALVIEKEVLNVFAAARQLAHNDKETGGLLLARISKEQVRIVEATMAEKRASISRILFMPSLRQKRLLVKEAFDRGLHFVGEWHTHPERDPIPSAIDKDSMEDSFRRSKHELNAFLMVIVGNRKGQLSVSITMHSEEGQTSLGQYKIRI